MAVRSLDGSVMAVHLQKKHNCVSVHLPMAEVSFERLDIPRVDMIAEARHHIRSMNAGEGPIGLVMDLSGVDLEGGKPARVMSQLSGQFPVSPPLPAHGGPNPGTQRRLCIAATLRR
jgi:hypothetical protein